MAVTVFLSSEGYWFCREYRAGKRELVCFGRGSEGERLARLCAERVNEVRIGEFIAAGTVCEICGRATKLRRDHCHRRQQWRVRLCDACNKGLGFFRDDPELLRLAAVYLETHDERRARMLRYRWRRLRVPNGYVPGQAPEPML